MNKEQALYSYAIHTVKEEGGTLSLVVNQCFPLNTIMQLKQTGHKKKPRHPQNPLPAEPQVGPNSVELLPDLVDKRFPLRHGCSRLEVMLPLCRSLV